MARISKTVWHNFPACALENEALRVVIVPDLGAKIVSLYDKTHQREWLVPPIRPVRQTAYGDDFVSQDMCGWDEMMPTIWVHGHSASVPTTEEQPRSPFGEYGINKVAVEAYLLDQARRHGFPATMLHPGHIAGPGWKIVNPAGNFNPVVFEKLARGEELALPNLGMETVHHVHAADVAQAFWKAMDHWSSAAGESFHVASPAALTLRGYAEAVAAWFGQPADLCFMPWEQWRVTVSEEDAERTWDHIAHSPNCSIAKAQRLLDYQPRYTSLQAIFESVDWLVSHGVIKTV